MSSQIDIYPMGDTFCMVSKPMRLFWGVGLALRREWWPAYIFLIIGASVIFYGLFTLGRKIVVVINPRDQALFMGRSWFRIPIYTKELRYTKDTDLSVSETLSSTSGNKQIQYFALYANALLDKLRAISFDR